MTLSYLMKITERGGGVGHEDGQRRGGETEEGGKWEMGNETLMTILRVIMGGGRGWSSMMEGEERKGGEGRRHEGGVAYVVGAWAVKRERARGKKRGGGNTGE